MNVNEDFKFRDDLIKTEKDTVPIELLTNPYKGVIYRYTNVAVKEQEEGTAKMQFDYDFLDVSNFTETTLRKDQKFNYFIGLLLNRLILEAVESKEDNGNRENNTEESDKE